MKESYVFSKKEVAVAQLSHAIEWHMLDSTNVIAVHASVAAANEVLFDVGQAQGLITQDKDKFYEWGLLRSLCSKDSTSLALGLKKLFSIRNFLKHAKKDASDHIQIVPDTNLIWLADTIYMFEKIYPNELKGYPHLAAFKVWLERFGGFYEFLVRNKLEVPEEVLSVLLPQYDVLNPFPPVVYYFDLLLIAGGTFSPAFDNYHKQVLARTNKISLI